MKNRKLYTALAVIMTVSTIGGCANGDRSGSTDAETTAAQSEAETTAEEQTESTEEDTESENQEGTTGAHLSANGIETSDDGIVREELTATEFAYLLGNGINLGNTMEAYGRPQFGTAADTSAYETFWGQPETTQDIISGMHNAGFDTLRIPVSWTNMMNYEDGDYTIADAYLDRVEEIINYALNEDMYVIVNAHWDGGWWGMFGSAAEETREDAMELYVSMWTQIAERYAEYGDHLILESANEELGDTLNAKTICPDSGALSTDELYETTNKINQVFVDTVRSTGGNNANRFLLIAGFNTDIEKTCDERFVMPRDTAESKLMLSVHYYNPWNYCGDGTTVNHWGTQSEYENQNELLGMMSKFVDEGIPVVVGEYGVLIEGDNPERENTTDFIGNLLDNCDYYGYVPLLWDRSTLYSRTDCAMKFEDTAELFLSRSFASQSSMTQDEERENAKVRMEEALKDAPVSFTNTDFDPDDVDTATAWIMWNGDMSYSVGDIYNPDDCTDGLTAITCQVTGEGTYTVSLDFTGTDAGAANGTTFSALAIYNGEILYPGYIMEITSLKVNEEEYELIAKPYTTNDNETTTRINLYNGWVNKTPKEARCLDGNLDNVSSCIIDNNMIGYDETVGYSQIKTIEITFDYIAPENSEAYLKEHQ